MSRRKNAAGAVDRRGHGSAVSARRSGSTATATARSRDIEDRGPSIRTRYVVGSAAHKMDAEPQAQPRQRRAATEPEKQKRSKSKQAAAPKRRLLSGMYGGLAAFMLMAGIAGALVVSSKVMIAGTQFKAELARAELQRSKAHRDQLAAKYTVMAASPEIQRIATKKLKMVTPAPENVVFLGPEPSARKLEKALKRLDKKGWKIKSYRKWLAAEKKARAKAAREARLRAAMPAAPASSGAQGFGTSAEPAAASQTATVQSPDSAPNEVRLADSTQAP